MAEIVLVTKGDLEAAEKVIKASRHVRRTPLLSGFPICDGCDVYLKMESMQNTGSFKIRGMVNIFAKNMSAANASVPAGAVTMSAGNAGRSFSYLAAQERLQAVVVMPDGVPKDRAESIRALGSEVEFAPLSELQTVVDRKVAEQGYFYAHPFDDLNLIAGHATVASEIMEECPDADIILVCCGGGGLVSGCAAAVKLRGNNPLCRVIAVEPEGAPTMSLSLKEGSPQDLDTDKYSTIAHGLAAPFAGPISFAHVKKFVDEVVLVSDDDLREATRFMFGLGFVTETSGCAAVAALRQGKVQNVAGKKVVCVVSGSNIKPNELQHECFD